MTTAGVEERLSAIQEQLDVIQHELQARKRHLAEMQELKEDLTVILKDVMRTAVVELDDVAPFLQTGDFLSLVKKILRNTNRISASLSKLESAGDFLADAKPVSFDIFTRFIHKLDELERKGYFKVGTDLEATMDALVRLLAANNVLPAIGRSLETA
jgi:DNA repair exonuclease SbcCD ATPase subunit